MPAPLVVLDRVLSLEPGKRGSAIRNVPNTLIIFDTHFPRFPVLPGVLILGSMGLLAAKVLDEGDGWWRLAQAERVRFRHFVQPGDQLDLSVEVKDATASTATCTATASVDGKPVTTVGRLRMARAERGDGGAR